MLTKGTFVLFDGVLAVIVGTETDNNIPEGHVALWYGQDKAEGFKEFPEIWTVPIEFCQPAPSAKIRH